MARGSSRSSRLNSVSWTGAQGTARGQPGRGWAIRGRLTGRFKAKNSFLCGVSGSAYVPGAELDIGGGRIAGETAVLDHIPPLQRAHHRELPAVGDVGQHPGLDRGPGPQTEHPAAQSRVCSLGLLGRHQGEIKIPEDPRRHRLGDGVQIVPQPEGVLDVVVIPQLQQNGGSPGAGHLSQVQSGHGKNSRLSAHRCSRQ